MVNREIDPQAHLILLVEDAAINARIMTAVLQRAGYGVCWVSSGEKALEMALAQKPDLILLDVVLPGIDGFEVCRRLKAETQTAEAPIIFMTGLSEVDNKVEGFELGAVDYITKPIRSQEVLARIHTHLTLRNLQKGLEQEIHERERLIADLDAFAHTVAHDLKSPLHSVMGFAEMLQIYHDRMSPSQIVEMATNIRAGGQKIVDITDNLLLLAQTRRLDTVEKSPLSMKCIVGEVIERLTPMINEYHAEMLVPDQWPEAVGYAPWVEEIWINYVTNALKYGGRPPVIELGAEPFSNGFIKFWVKDNGQGLAPEEIDRLFQPFQRLSKDTNVKGHGLGLSIVQRIAEQLGGSVGVESEPGAGSSFYFLLPAVPETAVYPPDPVPVAYEKVIG